MRVRPLTLLLLLMVCCFPALTQGGPDRAAAANARTPGQLSDACTAGAAFDCNELGLLYLRGTGVARDEKAALAFFRKACSGDLAGGCWNYSLALGKGVGTAVDNRGALNAANRACMLGSAEGCNLLGRAYESGFELVVPDRSTAVTFYRKACAGGLQEACAGQKRMEMAASAPAPAPVYRPPPRPQQQQQQQAAATPRPIYVAPKPAPVSAAPAPATPAPADNSPGYALYVAAQQKEAAFIRFRDEVQSRPNWKNSSAGYQIGQQRSAVFWAYRDACSKGYGRGCVEAERVSPGLREILYTQACYNGYRPACANQAELATLSKIEDEKAGIFRGPGRPATAEELRLQKLCESSQWSYCLPFSKLAAARLLTNCNLGNEDACLEYAAQAESKNLPELRDVWRSAQAFPALQRLCASWTRDKGSYDSYCRMKLIVEQRLAYLAMPTTSAGTTREQRQKCLRYGFGADGTTTDSEVRDLTGDVVRVDRSQNVTSYYTNTCRYPVEAYCGFADVQRLITLPAGKTTTSCPALTAK